MRTTARRWSAVAVALAVLVVLVVLGASVAGRAVPAAAQQPTTTALTVPTSVRQPVGDDADETDAADRIWLIIAGLVVVAVLLTALTLRYWWVTRPTTDAEDEEEAAPAPAPTPAPAPAPAPADGGTGGEPATA